MIVCEWIIRRQLLLLHCLPQSRFWRLCVLIPFSIFLDLKQVKAHDQRLTGSSDLKTNKWRIRLLWLPSTVYDCCWQYQQAKVNQDYHQKGIKTGIGIVVWALGIYLMNGKLRIKPTRMVLFLIFIKIMQSTYIQTYAIYVYINNFDVVDFHFWQRLTKTTYRGATYVNARWSVLRDTKDWLGCSYFLVSWGLL